LNVVENNILKISITASNKERLIQYLKARELDIGCAGGIRPQADGSIEVEAFVPPSYLDNRSLEPGIQIKVLTEAVSRGIERQKEVNPQNKNRFADDPEGRISGPGIKE
jgi:hypothetical protein